MIQLVCSSNSQLCQQKMRSGRDDFSCSGFCTKKVFLYIENSKGFSFALFPWLGGKTSIKTVKLTNVEHRARIIWIRTDRGGLLHFVAFYLDAESSLQYFVGSESIKQAIDSVATSLVATTLESSIPIKVTFSVDFKKLVRLVRSHR